MYNVHWSEFHSMDRGGSTPKYRTYTLLKTAKAQALLRSQDPMVPGLVVVRDKQGNQKCAYQQGKLNVPLGGKR